MVYEARFEPERLHHKETVFTIGNGYQCMRGAFEEGYPGEHGAAFVHRLWDYTPLHFEELANIPRWWGADIWVDGERFRLDRGEVLSYRRDLDLRTGLLTRRVRWRPRPDGPLVALTFRRFVSLAEAHVGAVQIDVDLVEGEAEVRMRAGLDAHATNPLPAAPVDDMGLMHWRLLHQTQDESEATLLVQTRASEVTLALAACIEAERTGSVAKSVSNEAIRATFCDADGQPAAERSVHLSEGEGLRLQKFVGVVSEFDALNPHRTALRVARQARSAGWDALFKANARAWQDVWEAGDIEVEGDIEAQIALRFNLFQLIIAAPRFTEFASIGAKTLSGFGYRHHVFWDTDIFMLPYFTYTQPHLARNMLMYRYHTLPAAREKARANGHEGAQFPWESASDGREVTPTWVPHPTDPTRLIRIWTGDIEIHITADIAYAVMQYWRVTGDDAWMRDFGAEIVLDGAKFWASAARLEEDGRYHYRDVIGPDEYHDHVDDNAYTNALAKWHLQTAFEVLDWLKTHFPGKRRQLVLDLKLTPDRLLHWRDVIERLHIPQDEKSGLIEQFSGYFELQEPDFATLRDPNRTHSMQTLLGIEGCAATQIIKQPDVLMLQYLLPDWFDEGQMRVNYDYYNPRTDHEHGSSLGPSISAIMAARVGDIAAAYEHFMRAARADLQDVRHNAGDGIHGASAGGLWMAAVFGFGGLEIQDDGWVARPRLPRHWTRLAFRFMLRGRSHSVELTPNANSPPPQKSGRAVSDVLADE
ncbi:MAG: glycoside hydrolase family 65 protein [Chloroflexi bacterium]|nr:glycoside hydrolase family 65 protein [Chloroflexota bacterium]